MVKCYSCGDEIDFNFAFYTYVYRKDNNEFITFYYCADDCIKQ